MAIHKGRKPETETRAIARHLRSLSTFAERHMPIDADMLSSMAGRLDAVADEIEED